ncbi:general substrate transporter [Mycotypha africana]|uniref:general substrate transporter n=1 Tax=Mycotypha africana TaxID=64632 RepID=UPI0023012137|nr:general substrate transporter [Mycotypha africana]KAI8979369.1 general substrate transporter [Mycotypha africana]
MKRLLRGNALLYSVAGFASLGQFLFGYDQGVMSGILVNDRWLSLMSYPNATMQGLVVAIFELGAWATTSLASWCMDKIGRRWTILVGSAVFIVGGVLQTAAVTLTQIMFGRLIAGFGIGFLSTCLPVYTAELSRAHNRGKVTVFGMSINMLGYTASEFIDYGFTYVDSEWSFRGPLLLQVAFALILAVGTTALPESPRYLVSKSKDVLAITTLANMHGRDEDHPDVTEEYDEIKTTLQMEATLGQPTWKEMFTTYKKRTWIGIAVQALGQMSGINIVTYYAPKMYEAVLGPGNQTILFAGFTALVYFSGAIIAAFLVDRVGRRPLFMYGSFFMILWLVLMAVFNKISLGLTSAILVITFTMVYVGTFGITWACVDWLYPAEIFPFRTRAKGMSLAVASNWLSNFAVGLFTPPLLEAIGWATYIFYAAWNLVALFVVWRWFVETKGKSLEEIEAMFADGAAVTSTTTSPRSERENDSLTEKPSVEQIP